MDLVYYRNFSRLRVDLNSESESLEELEPPAVVLDLANTPFPFLFPGLLPNSET